MMSYDDNDDQMIFGVLGSLKLLDICLTGEEKPRKTSPRKPVPTGDRTRARCVTGAHATTAVDIFLSVLHLGFRIFSEMKRFYGCFVILQTSISIKHFSCWWYRPIASFTFLIQDIPNSGDRFIRKFKPGPNIILY